MRNETKQVCYGILYGAGMTQLADVLQISVLEARDIQRSFNDMFPGIARFIANTKAFCRKRGNWWEQDL
jgi:DNA polymerase I-like protein with 3'-5' exonuclease and polymerase domains